MSGKPRALAGRNTSNSVPGGIFAVRQDEPRALVDGLVNGRFNSSSVVGGLFAGEEPNVRPGLRMAPTDNAQHHLASSVPNGIFGSSDARPPTMASTQSRDPGPILGGGGGGMAAKWGGGAAGGRATNAHNDGFHGGRLCKQPADLAKAEGVATPFSVMGPTGVSPPAGARASERDDFLERVDEAAARDAAEMRQLQQLLEELESQAGVIHAAAAQIAAEQRLSRADEQSLRHKMLGRVHEQAEALRTQMAQLERPPARAATLDGIFAYADASPAGAAMPADPWPASRGRGAYNPAHQPTAEVTAFHPTGSTGSAGAPVGEAAGLSAARIGTAQKELRIEHHPAASKAAAIASGGFDPRASKVSFGGNARILYPGATVMYRGKPPGY